MALEDFTVPVRVLRFVVLASDRLDDLPKLKFAQLSIKAWRDKLAKKKEVAISSEPVYRKPPKKMVEKPKKPVK